MLTTWRDAQPDPPGITTRTTRDHEAIRRWAAHHHAEPATGEATASGPRTVEVNDGGAGVRFNFPGNSRFRPINWDEWFESFDRHHLTFVYEEEDTEQVAARAHELGQARGREGGHEDEDWFEAERDLQHSAGGRPLSARYRCVRDDTER